MKFALRQGSAAALGAALLFGAGTPLAKLLLGQINPWLLAALLYLGSGVGLALWRWARHAEKVKPTRSEWGWLLTATATGGIVGPVLLMTGLAHLPAASTSLLLNAEGVLTALLAWFVFKENFDRRIALGMACITVGAVVLSWPTSLSAEWFTQAFFTSIWPALAVLGACLAWAIDNNLTRKVSLTDASFIAMVKGLVAGTTNLGFALWLGASWPADSVVLAAVVLGFLSYGASLVLFVLALRQLGSARTGAYFSVAPFFGTLLAVGLLGETITLPLLIAGALMALGVWLHLTEHHQHPHSHKEMEHNHEHVHDEHHQHVHDTEVAPGVSHQHQHRHVSQTHVHAHFPDAHHQHNH